VWDGGTPFSDEGGDGVTCQGKSVRIGDVVEGGD
jgi:hypothetical protein